MTTVIKPIKISSRIMLKRFMPALGSFTGRLALVRELVHTTDIMHITITQGIHEWSQPWTHVSKTLSDFSYYILLEDLPPPLQPFYGPFSGTTRVSRCQKSNSGLYGARED